MVRKIFFLFLLIFLISSEGYSEDLGTVKGRVAYKGEVIENVSILVFREKDDTNLTKPDMIGARTAIDGTYEFKLTPGRYYLVALKKMKDDGSFIPSPGDYYCFYSGAPVEVVSNGISYVGFNLIKVEKGGVDKKTAREGGIYGKITFEGKPIEKSYLYVYKDLKTGLRGPAYLVYPSRDGSFTLNLPEGRYYIIARKRAKGGMYGPIEEGDLFNFYYGNPVMVKKGVMKNVNIECVKRLSQLEEGVGFSELTGYVKDNKGKPVQGLFVLLYQNKNMQGKPLYISSRTDREGKFSIRIPRGEYFILARENIGGPPNMGEWYGKFKEPVNVKDQEKIENINILVEKRR